MKIKIVLTGLIMLLVSLMGCNGEKSSEVLVALVNEEAIYQKDWENRYRIIKLNYEMMMGQELSEKEEPDMVDNLKHMAFEDLILQKLLMQEAIREGIIIDNKEIEDSLNYIKETKTAAGKDGFTKFLADVGIDENYIKEELKTEQIFMTLRSRVTGDIKIAENEARNYYEKNSSQYFEAGGIRISHILMETEEQARDILVKIQAGEDFAVLAQKHSLCPSKDAQGNLGIVNQDSALVETFKTAALKLKPGNLTSEPILTEFGYHIIKAGELVEDQVVPFEMVKEEIIYQLESLEKDEVFFSYLEELRENAAIEDLR